MNSECPYLYNKCKFCNETIFNNIDINKLSHEGCRQCKTCLEITLHGATHRCRTFQCECCGETMHYGVWHYCRKQVFINKMKEKIKK